MDDFTEGAPPIEQDPVWWWLNAAMWEAEMDTDRDDAGS